VDSIYRHVGKIFASVYRPIVFEFGANSGQDTVALLEILQAPLYFALEPDTRNLATLRQRGLDRLVHLVPAAIGATNGVTTLFQSTKAENVVFTGASSIRAPGDVGGWIEFASTEQVLLVTFDRLCEANGIEHVDFIWADVQGAEGDMIEGGRQALTHTRYLYTEYADRPIYDGQWSFDRILAELPGWEVVARYEPEVDARSGDVLLRNARYAAELAGRS
jgi:FkbM family methyltransferase